MRSSNLAECLDEFAATVVAVDPPTENPSLTAPMEDAGAPRRPARSLSFDSRRIQIRDMGFRHFRVF